MNIKQHGFTLIELSIVLFIVGLVMTGGLKLLSALSANTGITETRQNLNVIDRALISYVINDDTDIRPPIPAMADVDFAGWNIGQGMCHCDCPTGATCPSGLIPGTNVEGCADDPFCAVDKRSVRRSLPAPIGAAIDDPDDANYSIGRVPFADLGMENLTDFWNQDIFYRVKKTALIDGVHSQGSGVAYEVYSIAPDDLNYLRISITRYYAEIVGLLVTAGITVD